MTVETVSPGQPQNRTRRLRDALVHEMGALQASHARITRIREDVMERYVGWRELDGQNVNRQLSELVTSLRTLETEMTALEDCYLGSIGVDDVYQEWMDERSRRRRGASSDPGVQRRDIGIVGDGTGDVGVGERYGEG